MQILSETLLLFADQIGIIESHLSIYILFLFVLFFFTIHIHTPLLLRRGGSLPRLLLLLMLLKACETALTAALGCL